MLLSHRDPHPQPLYFLFSIYCLVFCNGFIFFRSRTPSKFLPNPSATAANPDYILIKSQIHQSIHLLSPFILLSLYYLEFEISWSSRGWQQLSQPLACAKVREQQHRVHARGLLLRVFRQRISKLRATGLQENHIYLGRRMELQHVRRERRNWGSATALYRDLRQRVVSQYQGQQ
jgi:hypothetical protein